MEWHGRPARESRAQMRVPHLNCITTNLKVRKGGLPPLLRYIMSWKTKDERGQATLPDLEMTNLVRFMLNRILIYTFLNNCIFLLIVSVSVFAQKHATVQVCKPATFPVFNRLPKIYTQNLATVRIMMALVLVNPFLPSFET